MEIRRLAVDDARELARLHSTVYTAPSDLTVTEELKRLCPQGWGVYEDGRLKSAMLSRPFRMMMNGQVVAVAGIGGVGTFPEDRRRGHVRKLFDRVFPDMREQGQVFSTLFPFSFPYYRMFGYEHVYQKSVYEFPLSELDPSGRTGTMEEVKADDPAAVAAVYQTFATCRNLPFVRDNDSWKRRLKAQPTKDQVFAYLCRDKDGTPCAYFQYKAEPNGPHNCNVMGWDVAWTGSLNNLLAWLSVLWPHAERATLHLPTDVRAELHFPEPYRLRHQVLADYMGRVVDVEAALRGHDGPRGESMVLTVRDDYLDWNSGTYEVSWDSPGSATVKRTRKTQDLAMDVTTLAQLLVGFLDGAEALTAGLLETGLESERLRRVFPRRPLYQNDPF